MSKHNAAEVNFCTGIRVWHYSSIYGAKMGNADFLSRLPLSAPSNITDEFKEVGNGSKFSFKYIRSRKNDWEEFHLLYTVFNWVLRDWPDNLAKTDQNLKSLLQWLFAILHALHSKRPGIVRMRALARFGGHTCHPYQEARPEIVQAPVIAWEMTEHPWCGIFTQGGLKYI